jgi:hypothetical protein
VEGAIGKQRGVADFLSHPKTAEIAGSGDCARLRFSRMFVLNELNASRSYAIDANDFAWVFFK